MQVRSNQLPVCSDNDVFVYHFDLADGGFCELTIHKVTREWTIEVSDEDDNGEFIHRPLSSDQLRIIRSHLPDRFFG